MYHNFWGLLPLCTSKEKHVRAIPFVGPIFLRLFEPHHRNGDLYRLAEERKLVRIL